MTNPNYMMITVAKCAPSFVSTAFEHLAVLAAELKSDAGAVSVRYGMIATGEHTGQLILFQTYEEMNGIDAAFGVYGKSSAYTSLTGGGDIAVTLRSILKIEDIGLQNPSTDVPAYGVVTRWGSADLHLDTLRQEVPHLENNGAMIMRYCTILTGTSAGRRLLVAGYPSMDAIEKTYTALRGSAGYNAFMEKIDVDFRNILRVMG